MRVLITGAFGFLGKTISNTFKERGHEVYELGRSAGDFQVDLSKKAPRFDKSFDTVIHAAGKAHLVPKTEEEIQDFFDVNLQGTENLIAGLKEPPKSFAFISTVAVYGSEAGELISEQNPLSGSTPYAQSKIAAEQFVTKWGRSHDVRVLILRLPLLVGPDPPGNLGKMINGISRGRYLSINKGAARRSMVMTDDVANLLEENTNGEGIYNLTDGHHPSFREVETLICKQLDKSLPFSLPLWLARVVGRIGDVVPGSPVGSHTIEKMTADLTFDDSLARTNLDWQPRSVVKEFKVF